MICASAVLGFGVIGSLTELNLDYFALARAYRRSYWTMFKIVVVVGY